MAPGCADSKGDGTPETRHRFPGRGYYPAGALAAAVYCCGCCATAAASAARPWPRLYCGAEVTPACEIGGCPGDFISRFRTRRTAVL